MEKTSYEGVTYRLRAGSPMPISEKGSFVIHSFKAERQVQNIYTCAYELLASSDFRGQGGNFTAASYTRLPVIGQSIYKASETENPKYIEELED